LGEADKKRADEVATTKLAADRAVKEAEVRVTRAKKAMAKISKKQSQRKEAIIKRFDDLLTAFGSKYRLIASSLILPLFFIRFPWLLFCDAAKQLGEVIRLCTGEAKDPLLDVVGLLESNCRNVRTILQCTRHVLPHLFSRLFLKKRKEMSTCNLRKLVEAFDTPEDPRIQVKLSSVKRGVEGTTALALSHGENIDWDKVSSSHARRLEEMKEYFSEAKRYAPNLVSLILPEPTPSTAMPSSSAPPTLDSTPSKVS
jgi:hypothetical protein